MNDLPNFGRRRVQRRIPALLMPLTIGLYRAAIVEVADQWLRRGYSLSATAAALDMNTPTLCKLVQAARRDGPHGLVPRNFRSGRKPGKKAKAGSAQIDSTVAPGVLGRPARGVVTR